MIIKNKKNEITLGQVFSVGFIITTLSSWAYGNSYYLYALSSVLLCGYVYIDFLNLVINGYKKGTGKSVLIVFLLLVVSFFTALLTGSLKSTIMTNVSILLPFSIGYSEISYCGLKKQIIKSSGVILAVATMAMLFPREQWNTNSLGILISVGMSIGYVWLLVSGNKKSRLLALGYILVSALYVFFTETRNTAIVLALMCIIILIPERIYQKTPLLRALGIISIVSTVFSPYIMEAIFNNSSAMKWLTNFTSRISTKTYGMSSHLTIILYVKDRFSHFDIFAKIFGEGIKRFHAHNLFYQCLTFYGYFGTVIIYGFFIYIFNMGYCLYKKHGDKLALGSCFMMICYFLMQNAEVFMNGLETTNISAFIPMGIILNLNRVYKKVSNYEAVVNI